MYAKVRKTINQTLRRLLGKRGYEIFRFYYVHGYFPDLEKPRSFSEKLIYRKLYVKDHRFVELSDKWLVRNYVKERIGDRFLSKVYWVGEAFDLITLGHFPDKFVIKPNFGSGPDFIQFIEREMVTIDNLKTLTIELLSKEFGKETNEWWYTKIPKKVLIEEFLTEDSINPPLDYKFFVFSGKVHYVQVDYDRFSNHTRTFYNPNWEVQPFEYGYPRGRTSQTPVKLSMMIDIAEALAKDFDFVRVDLYYLNDQDRIVFGEMTFCPGAGWEKITPFKYDWLLGSLWDM